MSVTVKNVSKKIRGVSVLNNISIQFDDGEIYGLIGQNGAGKTMLIRAISGLLIPTQGEIIVDGKVLHTDVDFPLGVGVTIEHSEMHGDLSGMANLVALSKIRRVASREDIENAMLAVGLDRQTWNIKVSQYSLGMKQKLAIAQAIFEKPNLLLLDEPTNALDARSIGLLGELLIKLAKQGTTVIIASHDNANLYPLANTLVHMENGRIIKIEKMLNEFTEV